MESFLGNNRHTRRKSRAEARRRVRVLRRMCARPGDFEALCAEVVATDQEVMSGRLRLMAYAAFHHGTITEAEAILFNCKFEGKKR